MKKSIKYCSVFHQDASETVAYNNPLFPCLRRIQFPVLLSRLFLYQPLARGFGIDPDKRGAMTYNVNGALVELTEKCGILVNSRQLHYGFSAAHWECEFICLLFSPELLAGNEWFYQNYVTCITENSSYPYLYLAPENWTAVILQKGRGILCFLSEPAGKSIILFCRDFCF